MAVQKTIVEDVPVNKVDVVVEALMQEFPTFTTVSKMAEVDEDGKAVIVEIPKIHDLKLSVSRYTAGNATIRHEGNIAAPLVKNMAAYARGFLKGIGE